RGRRRMRLRRRNGIRQRGVTRLAAGAGSRRGLTPLSPVLRGEGQGEGPRAAGAGLRRSTGPARSPSPPPSPLGTGERGNGARSSDASAPAKRQTVAELRELQRLALKAITRPLAPG